MINRRDFFSQLGSGMGALALTGMMQNSAHRPLLKLLLGPF